MYRVSPFTYYVSATLSTGVARAPVTCSDIEILKMPPPSGMTCQDFLNPVIQMTKQGEVLNKNATDMCEFCPISVTDAFLAGVDIYYDQRWRNIGILFAYIAVNIAGAIGLYWLLRVPKKWSKKSKT